MYDICYRDFTISYQATDDTGQKVYLSLLSDWDLDAAFFGASDPQLNLKVDLKPFEEGRTLRKLLLFTTDSALIKCCSL